MAEPLLGRVLGGRFQITGHIGEGAMASVFRGVDRERPPPNEVAIKVMHPHLAQDFTFTGRFKREAQAASMVTHPNSVAILNIGEERGTHYLVMELCPGRDLRETLKLERRLPAARAARILMAVCEALTVAHQLGVVHRDLKPENVVVLFDPATGTDSVKVLDFGIAKLVDQQPKARPTGSTDSEPPAALTQMGVVVGTPQYMSPEQCRGQPLDGRSDLYTCGILLFQLVTGTLPFNSDSPIEVAGKQAFEPPPAPSSVLPTIDRDLEALILRTLSKNPAERPQTASELRDLLARFASGSGPQPQQPPQRGTGYTQPMSAVAQSLDELIAQRRDAQAGGPFQPLGQQAPAAQSGPFAPPTQTPLPHRPQLGTAIEIAPQLHPLSGTTIEPAPSLSPSPQGVPAAPPVPTAQAPAPYPVGAALPPAAPERSGWGVTGFLLILVSLALGVGLGFGLYRFGHF